jgi:hypothetical protein
LNLGDKFPAANFVYQHLILAENSTRPSLVPWSHFMKIRFFLGLIVLNILSLALACGGSDSVAPSSVEATPPPTSSGPPSASQVGPRSLTTAASGNALAPGSYSQQSFTTSVSFASAVGTYAFTDCEFTQGFDVVFGGSSVSREITLEHCRIQGGLYFEDGGQKNWTIRWCDLLGQNQAIRPKGITIYDTVSPTPFVVEDSIVEISGQGTPTAHCEAMQSLGGNQMRFTRVRFITPGPYVDGSTGQTASVNHCGGDTIFESCEFLSTAAFYYTVYSVGNNVQFQNCRFGKGIAGYLYPNPDPQVPQPTFTGCSDYGSGTSLP